MATQILAESSAAVSTVVPPSYSELLDALCDLTFAPLNVTAQQRAADVLARVPVEAEA